MKIVLFDLGRTLEVNDVLLPGAKETLQAIRELRDASGQPPALALLSDYFPTERELAGWRDQYITLLDRLALREFFEPVDKQVTISTEFVELVFKPDPRVFRAAIDKINPGAPFEDTVFITERLAHVTRARDLGMRAIHFQGPGEVTGDVRRLIDLVPLVKAFVESD